MALAKISQLQIGSCDFENDCSRLIEFIEDMLDFDRKNFDKKEEKELYLLLKKLKDLKTAVNEITKLGNSQTE